MADFAGVADWSLQAVVGGSANKSFTPMADSYGMWDMMPQVNNSDVHEDDFLVALSEIFGQTSNKLVDDDEDDGLEALYKPFYPPVSDAISTQTTTSHVSSSISPLKDVKDEAEEVDQSSSTCNNIVATSYEPKYKRRKNQQKREVIHVKAEDLSSDRWAWRKYGQKPIKGSPYPRSYYRCSSKKGCLARKQVEQSCADPSMYILIYTAEHCHSPPTRRNSLAGTVRSKLPTPIINTNDHKANEAKIDDPIVTSSPASHEVITSSPSSSPEKTMVKQENLHGGDFEEFFLSDIMMNGDDFFAGLEDLNNGSF